MKFKIKVKENQRDKTKGFLNDFVNSAREEFDKQMGEATNRIKNIPTPIPVKYPEIVFDMDFYEEDGYFILWNTVSTKGIMKLIAWRLKKVMEKNLRAFLKENGIDADIKYLGE